MKTGRWFYNGTYMKDGTPITVAAYNEAQARDFLERGFIPVEGVAETVKKGRKKKDELQGRHGRNPGGKDRLG